ncbi:MAG: thiamine phosphate synthase [Gammaproteobacteria bacterium]|nr:thiamine phosphate synthase [Gammaproteobacteria bacterium]
MTRHLLRGLYAITDESLMPENNFLDSAEQALLGGARLLQYRDKSHDQNKRLLQASALKQYCQRHGALLIINDDIDLALQVQADGIHLGEDDASIDLARRILGSNAIIGISCYNQLELALQAETAGADYVAFGAFFTSPTKPNARVATLELLQAAKQQLRIPVCAIGGITTNNAGMLVEHGADMTAVISDLFSSDDICTSASHIARLFS